MEGGSGVEAVGLASSAHIRDDGSRCGVLKSKVARVSEATSHAEEPIILHTDLLHAPEGRAPDLSVHLVDSHECARRRRGRARSREAGERKRKVGRCALMWRRDGVVIWAVDCEISGSPRRVP